MKIFPERQRFYPVGIVQPKTLVFDLERCELLITIKPPKNKKFGETWVFSFETGEVKPISNNHRVLIINWPIILENEKDIKDNLM
jgi:hypothetical protein